MLHWRFRTEPFLSGPTERFGASLNPAESRESESAVGPVEKWSAISALTPFLWTIIPNTAERRLRSSRGLCPKYDPRADLRTGQDPASVFGSKGTRFPSANRFPPLRREHLSSSCG